MTDFIKNDLKKSNSIVYNNITNALIDLGYTISTMESCTSGLISTLLTNTEGSSKILKGAFVTYSNEAKIMQGVSKECIDKYGVYSMETAMEMANACKKAYNSDIGIGVTGLLDIIDEQNDNFTSNEVFYVINYKDSVFVKNTISIPNDITDRFERKMYVANNIGIYLFDVLYDNNLLEDD